jgi:hypothetical protein
MVWPLILIRKIKTKYPTGWSFYELLYNIFIVGVAKIEIR